MNTTSSPKPSSQLAEQRGIFHRVMTDDGLFAGVLTGFFAILCFVGVLRHELWRDEAQAWCIALHSSNIQELFYNLRYEMHPPLWHLILFAITRFTHNPLSMQIVHVGIISLAVFLFTRLSPFSKLQKSLFCLGYFPFYEYGVISRSYSIVMLLLFTICSVWPRRSRSHLILFLLLSLLAISNAYGFLLSGVIAVTMIAELCFLQVPFFKDCRKSFTVGLIIYASSCLFSLTQLIPPPDGCFGEWNNKPVTVEENRLVRTLGTIWASYIPIPDVTTYNTWNTNFLSPTGVSREIEIPLGIAMVLFGCAMFLKRRMVLFLYALGTSVLLAFAYAKLIGGVRQQGHLFELLLVCMWLARDYREESISKALDRLAVPQRLAGVFCTTLLSIQAIAGIYSYAVDIVRPFSASALVANYLKKNHLTDKLIIGTNDHEVIPISALIDRKIYYPESETFGSYVRNDKSRHTLNFDETFRRVRTLLVDRNCDDAILITNYPLGGFPKGFNLTVLKVFGQAIQSDEVFFVYSISLKLETLAPAAPLRAQNEPSTPVVVKPESNSVVKQ